MNIKIGTGTTAEQHETRFFAFQMIVLIPKIVVVIRMPIFSDANINSGSSNKPCIVSE